MRTALALLVAAALVAACPATGRAAEVSGAELRSLAKRAAADASALERLRKVDRVDGRPADIGRALSGAAGAELAARLEALARAPAGTASRTADARREAREILDGRRYSPTRLPGPFRGVLDRLADWLSPVIGVIPALDDIVPGGRPVVWLLLALLVAGAAAAVAIRTLQRRTASPRRGAPWRPAPVHDDPDELERIAGEAAARGDHELALRLGFRAGLLRLDRRGVIDLRPSLATADVGRALRSEDFDRVATRFDEVAYGGRPAAAADVEAARAGWEAVLIGGRRA